MLEWLFFLCFCRGHATYKSPCRSVRRSVGPSVRPSHFAFFAFLGSLRVEKFVFEHAPAQIISAPAQIITAPAQPPATGAVVYTALFPSVCLDQIYFFDNSLSL